MDLTGVGTLADSVKGILGMFFPDKTEEEKDKLTAALTMAQNIQDAANIQANTNLEEAKQPGMHFRDGAGWVCVAGLAVTVLKPLIEWGAALIGYPITLPAVDTSATNTMLYGLLGLGSLHAAPSIVGAFTKS